MEIPKIKPKLDEEGVVATVASVVLAVAEPEIIWYPPIEAPLFTALFKAEATELALDEDADETATLTTEDP